MQWAVLLPQTTDYHVQSYSFNSPHGKRFLLSLIRCRFPLSVPCWLQVDSVRTRCIVDKCAHTAASWPLWMQDVSTSARANA